MNKRRTWWNVLFFGGIFYSSFYGLCLAKADGSHKTSNSNTHSHRDDEHLHHHDHEAKNSSEQLTTSPNIGPEKAIVAASPQKGFVLSEVAKNKLEIRTTPVSGKPPTFLVPSSSIVFHEDDIGIYRVRKDWIKLIDVKVVGKTGTNIQIYTLELISGDQVVVGGVPLLRVAELNLWMDPTESDEH